MGWTRCPPEEVPENVLREPAPLPRRKSRARKKYEFRHHLLRWGCYAEAAARTGITDRTARRWRDEDPDFARGCALALATYEDDIQLAALHRLRTPEVKPVWYRGRQIGHIKRFNAALLLRLADGLARRRQRGVAK